MSHGKFEYKVIAIEGNDPGLIETFINGLGNSGFYIVGITEKMVFLCKSTLPPLTQEEIEERTVFLTPEDCSDNS